MSPPDAHITRELDAVIFGGGVAGLWLLDELHRRGHGVLLLEADALGAGQSIAAQGIIHGGLKYTLTGLLNPSAEAIRDMPDLWRRCLNGEAEPRLTNTRVRAEFCHLWRTQTLTSKLGMIGARKGLVVAPQPVSDDERPAALRGCPGQVMRLDEQVVAPYSLLNDLASKHTDRLLKIDAEAGLSIDTDAPAVVTSITLTDGGQRLTLRARHVVLTAGNGNAELRARCSLSQDAMQRRPLHFIMLRGPREALPELNGHCVDGAKTRVTITSDTDSQGRTVWQVGGQVTEDGVDMSPDELIAHTRRELEASIPGGSGVDLSAVEWATRRVDRAERTMPNRKRPDDAQLMVEGNVITGWPTKLALAPRLATRIADTVGQPHIGPNDLTTLDWPRPAVAQPHWETATSWTTAD